MSELFQVILEPEAIGGIESGYRFIERDSPGAAEKWIKGLMEAIESLDRMPKRCPLAPENDVFEPEIRQLLYGRQANIYRILFTVLADSVHILHVRHGAQRWLDAEDVPD